MEYKYEENTYLTSEELNLQGASPLGYENHHIPGILYRDDKPSLEEVVEKRREVGFFISPQASLAIGSRSILVFSLSELNEDGETLKDPEVIGFWDYKDERIINVDEKELQELTLKVYKTWYQDKYHYDSLQLREPWKSLVENPTTSPENRG